MAYQALYRKWRPVKFDDIIGQSHITDTIKNEVNTSRLAHAYLFTGTRGTGKTTTAKVLSRAVNCLSPQDGNPCNECDVCKAIMAETCLDVQEIDAASNTGVDNIRDIISQVQYLPSLGKYKVFIIDEVHMLSKGAFNALLKTLEEPPEHVIFILATTEIQQIPATILSRCQRFDFKTISISDIVYNIKLILSAENIEADDDALEYVAYLGDGSMRDSLSILDQCLAFASDSLSLAKVVDVVGAVDDKILYEFAADVAKKDTSSALARFNSCVNSGKNFDNIAKGLLSVFREIIMYKINRDDFSASRIKMNYLASCADSFDVPSLVNAINILSECIVSFKTFSSQRVAVECALVRLTTPEMNSDYDSVLARLSALEAKIASGNFAPAIAPTGQESRQQFDDIPLPEPPPEQYGYDAVEAPVVSDVQASSSALSGDAGKVEANWQDIMTHICSSGKLTLYTMLFDAKVRTEDGAVVLNVDDQDKKHALSEKENITAIKEAIASVTGTNADVRITADVSPFDGDGDDVFAQLGELGKNFPSNFNIE
ncbi:MAG: DNA polymerase III subunit gamma/tau [Clostridia bacterium]|nr:DNA polymerase III subunit gamma/tau [Clostridia bacterium]